ncbi:MAG: ATP-dependent RecD-like DNA helicase [Butyricicoccus sp.]|nr:ATP-dependent RecD-like DNA helicase [Butyricicoccus sp.]
MTEKELTELSGTVCAIIYANEENGYTVLRVETTDGGKVTATGCLPFAAPGEQITMYGEWTRHPSHGEQFRADYAHRSMPTGAQAIYEYLASRVIKGVGPATASVIVSQFGDASLEVIENEPERIAALRGIGRKKAMEISQALRRQTGLRRLMEFLGAHALKMQYAMRLYQFYGEQAREVISENPYVICMPHIGGEFAEADALALDLGFEGDSAERIAAAIVFELEHNTGNGHVFIPKEKLLPVTAQLIDVGLEAVEEGFEVLTDAGDIVCESVAGCQACYLQALYDAELYTARRIGEMVSSGVEGEAELDSIIEGVEREQGIHYAPMQRKTLDMAAKNRIMVITGGPGTGKTTTVRAIIAMFEHMGLRVQLAAPTGRAAKRMTELTGHEASTIHRLLEAGYAPDGFELVFRRDEDEPLKCDALILDECSMVDIELMRALLAALPRECRLVLVGDADQLPSVGPGNAFMDILRSNVVPTVRLTEIFRQTAGSRIVRNAHMINAGEHPNIAENKGDFFFMRRLNQDAAAELICQLCSKRLPENMKIMPQDIQVLTPTKKGVCGTFNLNLLLQRSLNPPAEGKNEKKFGEIVFREGDRVMQIRNDYDIIWASSDNAVKGTGVFNGDIGYISAIDAAKEMLIVDYDGRLASYGFEMLAELEHAWAMTVHKSQGSEYRAVILCLNGGPQPLLHRGVLYTAVTRARELLIIVGDEQVVWKMIDNHRQARRYSGLRARLAGD